MTLVAVTRSCSRCARGPRSRASRSPARCTCCSTATIGVLGVAVLRPRRDQVRDRWLSSHAAARRPRARTPDRAVTRVASARVRRASPSSLWVVTVRRADYSLMGQLGLVTILGPAYFVGLALLVARASSSSSCSRRPARAGSSRSSSCSSCFLFGTPCAVEPIAALDERWIHAGFVRYIFVARPPAQRLRRGVLVARRVLARRARRRVHGQDQRARPASLVPARDRAGLPRPDARHREGERRVRRAGWLGIALFYGTDWIYQDYFSPQALNLLFFLVDVAVVLSVLAARSRCAVARRRPALARAAALATMRRCGPTGSAATRRRRLVGAPRRRGVPRPVPRVPRASAMSHQLTPYAIVLALVACLLTRRLGRPELVAIAVRCSPSAG